LSVGERQFGFDVRDARAQLPRTGPLTKKTIYNATVDRRWRAGSEIPGEPSRKQVPFFPDGSECPGMRGNKSRPCGFIRIKISVTHDV
jgi:hypothetical protein